MGTSPFYSSKTSANKPARGLKARRRMNSRLGIERLEDRLVMATLDVTGGLLAYTAAAGTANNVFLNSDGTTETLSDLNDTVILYVNDFAVCFTVSPDFHTATGPDANVTSIVLNTEDGNDIIRLQSTIKPVAITPTNNAGGTQTIFLGNAAHGVQDLDSPITINNTIGTTTVNADDSANTASARTVQTFGSVLSGLTPSTVTLTQGAVSALNIFGGTQPNSFTFDGTLATTTTLNAGPGANSVSVHQLDATATLNATSTGSTTSIGNLNLLSGVLGTVNVIGTGAGTNLTVSDSADATARTLAISPTQITGFNASGLITFTGVNALAVFGGSAGNTFNISNTIPAIVSTFNTGVGNDTTNLLATAAGSTVNINGQDGLDLVNIGNAGLTAGIAGTALNISNVAGFSNVVVDDSNDATGTTASIAQTSLTGLTTGPINYVANDVGALMVHGGNGGNAFTINNPGSIYPITVTSGTGDDRFIFADQSNLGGGSIAAGAGSDTVDFTAYTTAASADLNSSPQTFSGNGAFTATGIETFLGGSGGNTITAPSGMPSTLTGGPGHDTFIIPADAGDVTVNGGGGADDLVIFGASAVGTPDTFTQTAVPATGRTDTVITGSTTTHTVSSLGIDAISLIGGGGDTTATLDFSGGNPIPAGGETYTGGGGVSNQLILVNDIPGAAPNSFTNEVYNATGPGAGNINFNSGGPVSTVAFSGLSPVIDSVSVLNYTFNAPAGISNISVTSDPAVNGLAGTLVANGNVNLPGFESAAVANKTNVTLNSLVGTNTTVTVNDPTPGAGLATLTINTGGGSDFVNLIATPTGVTSTVNGNDGNDVFNVQAGALGGPTFIDGAAGTNTVIFDAGGAVVVQTPTTLQAGAAGAILTLANVTTVTVNNVADLPLVGTAVPVTIQEGQPFSGVVGTFTTSTVGLLPGQVNPVANAADFSATITWGDGTTSTGTVVSNGTGGFSVVGTHTYTTTNTPPATPYPITIQVTHAASTSTSTTNGVTTTLTTNGGSTATINSSANVTNAPNTANGQPIVAVEGAPVPTGTLVATFTLAPGVISPASDFTATINFGDGTTIAGVITATGTPGTFSVTTGAAHTFAEEGTFVVTTTINGVGGFVSVATSTATVTDAALTATGTPVAAIEGTTFTAQVATFTDADPAGAIGDYTATVNFGDGTSALGTITQPGGVGTAFLVTATHTYRTFGSFAITTTVTDAGGATSTGSSTATVGGAALTPGTTTTITGTEGVPLTTVVGTFTSANPLATAADFTALVNFGDGTASAGTITEDSNGVFTVTATHTYAEETIGVPSVVTTTVRSRAGIVATLTGSAVIADAPLSASPIPINTVEGLTFPLTVATFVDTDPLGTASDYTATINWGDGTFTSGAAITFTATGGATALGRTFSVSASHTYRNEGNYLVTTTITDVGGSTTTTTSAANVADAGLVGTRIPIVAIEGIPLINAPVAAFIDLGGADTESAYVATIDWGDGTPQIRGLISLSSDGHTFLVNGSHTYAGDGVYSVHVLIQDEGGKQAVVLTTATVGELAVPITGNLDPASDSGVSNTDHITNVNQPTFNGTSEAGSVVNLFAANGLGTLFIGTGVADAGGHYSIRSTVALPDGQYVIYATSIAPGDINEIEGPTILLGTPTSPLLTIDTVGPVVTETIFRRSLGSVMLAFQDLGGGLTAGNIQDGANYTFRVLGKAGNLPNLITGFNTISSGGVNDPYEQFLRINNGRSLKSGRYVLTIKSGGITDIAGNALDGDYYGFVPSGNGKPGGDFQALLISNRSSTFRPIPTGSSASPVTPPGKLGQGFDTTGGSTTGTATATRTVAIKAAHGKAIVTPKLAVHANKAVPSPKVHDAALANVTVGKKGK